VSTAAPTTSLEVVTDLLGLRPATPGGLPGSRLGLVAGRRGPRFLVPLDWPEAAVASCLAYQGLRDGRTRLGRLAVGSALRVGAARAVIRSEFTADLDDGSLLGTLRDLLGRDDLAVAVGLGRMDELWRPTLQVFDPEGEPVAFVKVGRGAVVSPLVRTEGDALRRWMDHPDPRLIVPAVLGETTWRDQPILAVAPLPDDATRLPPGTIGAGAVRTLDPPIDDAPIHAAPWWADRHARFVDDPEIGPILERIRLRHAGPEERAWARWHGDWVPWNLARCHRGLIAWDWEYSEPGAPIGLDETHFAYQVAHLRDGRSVDDALRIARTVAPSAWVADAHVAMLVTRAGDLARTAGQPVTNHHDVLRAADQTIR